MDKRCFKCLETKPIAEFHLHPRMKDGHLNKCRSCTTEDTRRWRERKGKKENRRARYERELETGKRTRKRTAEEVKAASTPEIKRLIRITASLKYAHKRRAMTVVKSELDAFVFEEAVSLREIRNTLSSIRWHVDHIVPLNHRGVCGLHCAANLQVVPAAWNVRKSNKHTATFFGSY